ncbi:MAG: (2Fe-2S)-binding protein [Chloroflexi bacterium]|nr:(2Fe-2S)-binding protein [Chloroflexota bacterium]
MKQLLQLKVNGEEYEVFAEPWKTLVEVLREELGITAAKESCNTGNCGACTVLLDGKAVKGCLVLASQARGHDVMTLEGLSNGDGLHPIQQAFIDHFAVQCGFCTSGMILSAKALLDENKDPTEDDVRKAIAGNLCRCTGYKKIVEAILVAAEAMKQEA